MARPASGLPGLGVVVALDQFDLGQELGLGLDLGPELLGLGH